MNIEDIVPELFEEKKAYYCQRCINHGGYALRKGHKNLCEFRECQCSACIVSCFKVAAGRKLQMVERRRQLSNRLISMEASSASLSSVQSSSSGEDTSKIKERRPNCQRCAQHGVVNRLKGHKRACPFKECCCAKCLVVVERQKLMADQIKLRRRQKREKSAMVEKLRECTQTPSDPSKLKKKMRSVMNCIYGVTRATKPCYFAAAVKVLQDLIEKSVIGPVVHRPQVLGLQDQTRSFRTSKGLELSFSAENGSTICETCTQQVLTYQQLMSYLDPSTATEPIFNLAAVLQACPHRKQEED